MHLGPCEGPAAVHTRLGWALQGPVSPEDSTTADMESGINRYATPLPWLKTTPVLQAPKSVVMASLRHTEGQLAHNPDQAAIYNQEIDKLLQQGYVKHITPQEETQTSESWYIPHHLVEHNSKHRLVFNCSFKYQGSSLLPLRHMERDAPPSVYEWQVLPFGTTSSPF